MKITEIRTYPVAPAWIFIRMDTDVGISGWGEIPSGLGAAAATARVNAFSDVLLGADPRDIAPLIRQLAAHAAQQNLGGPSDTISGLEMALWDIKGKALGVPIHAILGGALRSSVPITPLCLGKTARDLGSVAKSCRVRGFTCVKTTLEAPIRPVNSRRLIEFTIERLAAIREELGAEIDIGINFQARTSPALALKLASAIEHLSPAFIQDPCPDDSLTGLSRVIRQTRIPIVTGKRRQRRNQFRDLLNACHISTIQPDVCIAGGILETSFIAALAEMDSVSVALQCTRGPIALAASLQLAACTPNIQRIEITNMPNQWDLGRGYLETPFLIDHGLIKLPEAPGLGITMDLKGIETRQWDGKVSLDMSRDAFDFD
ncbi:MAG: galactonate dehydratase [Verrucomicrobia bacterium]|nr:galactonate dehydratase [Verrucomicrobiota bacterium]